MVAKNDYAEEIDEGFEPYIISIVLNISSRAEAVPICVNWVFSDPHEPNTKLRWLCECYDYGREVTAVGSKKIMDYGQFPDIDTLVSW